MSAEQASDKKSAPGEPSQPPDKSFAATERLPRLRPDIEILEQAELGEQRYLVRDPRSERYFICRLHERRILDLLRNEPLTTAELIAEFRAATGLALSPASLARFLERLHGLGFLSNAGEAVSPDSIAPTAGTMPAALRRLFFVKLKVINPDPFLERLVPRLRWLLSAPAQYGILGSLGCAAVLLGLRLPQFWNDILYLVQPQFALLLVLIVCISGPLVAVFHEFAHALACKYYGGRVKEIGILLLYLSPAFYADVTASWAFPRKQRLVVAAAGIYMNVILMALLLFVWAFTPDRAWYHLGLLPIITSMFWAVLLNLIPLLRLDGYYLLCDLVNMPNLRQRSFAYLQSITLGRLKHSVEPSSRPTKYQPQNRRERAILLGYSLLALPCSALALAYTVIAVVTLLASRLRTLGIILIAIIAFLQLLPVLIAAPAFLRHRWKSMQQWFTTWRQGKLAHRRSAFPSS